MVWVARVVVLFMIFGVVVLVRSRSCDSSRVAVAVATTFLVQSQSES